MQSGNDKRPAVSQRINEFIQEHRKPIYVTAGAVTLLLIGSIVALALTDMLRGRAIAAVEELVSRHGALSHLVFEGDGPDGELAELLEDLRAFAPRHSGYAGGRAWSLLADIHGRRGEWAEAEAAWLAAAAATPRSYMAPIALFNAAAAAEEQGGAERAIEHYRRSIAAPAGFFAAPRAQFSIGRILESLGDDVAAAEAYRAVVSGWPHETTWTNLARSRIVAIETRPWRLEEPVIRPSAPFADAFTDFDFTDWEFDDGIDM